MNSNGKLLATNRHSARMSNDLKSPFTFEEWKKHRSTLF